MYVNKSQYSVYKRDNVKYKREQRTGVKTSVPICNKKDMKNINKNTECEWQSE